MSGDLDFRASVMIKAAMTSNAAPAVHVDACQALLSPDWFDGYFGGMKVEFEEQPVSILSKPGVGVCLMVQWKKHPAFKGKWPEVDMDLPSTRHLVQELADRGTNYRAFFNFGAFTATWQFVESMFTIPTRGRIC
ncbi:hypothetical protein PMIN07_007254 [Paraphaeosphaeria minitans]